MLMETEPIPMKPLVSQIIANCMPMLEEKHLGVDTQLADGMVAWGDEMWLQRALENLIVNAIYYSPDRGKNISVQLERIGEWIDISITDSGSGISE